MISHTLQLIFIHIPKTAGSSLTSFLQNYVANKVIQHDSKLGEKQGIKVICLMSRNICKTCYPMTTTFIAWI